MRDSADRNSLDLVRHNYAKLMARHLVVALFEASKIYLVGSQIDLVIIAVGSIFAKSHL